jgi:dTMP kinase
LQVICIIKKFKLYKAGGIFLMQYSLDWCKAKFISFEGGEGVGKTTNINFVANCLAEAKIPYIVTREPGGTEIAEQLRSILLKPTNEKLLPITELLIIFAARNQHLHQVILPALEKNICVLCDRFTDASFAYQGGGRNVEKSHIQYLQQLVQNSLRPHLTILFDAPVNIGMTRAKNRSQLDRIELEQLSFFERVRSAYLEQAKNPDHEYCIIDASDSLDNIQNKILQILSK